MTIRQPQNGFGMYPTTPMLSVPVEFLNDEADISKLAWMFLRMGQDHLERKADHTDKVLGRLLVEVGRELRAYGDTRADAMEVLGQGIAGDAEQFLASEAGESDAGGS